jgi:bla regulator protein BlaR1
MKLLEVIFSLILTASLASTVILMPLFLIRKLFSKHLGPRVMYGLWFLVLIKLLVPIAPQSPFSLFNLIPTAIHGQLNLDKQNIIPDVSSETEASYQSQVTINIEENRNQSPVPDQTEERSSDMAKPSPHMNAYEQHQLGLKNWLAIGSLIWLGGLFVMGLYYLFVTLRFRKSVETSREIQAS